MWRFSWKYFKIFFLLIILVSVENTRIDREGATLIEVQAFSAGSASWQSVSPLNTQHILDNLEVLDDVRKIVKKDEQTRERNFYWGAVEGDVWEQKYLQMDTTRDSAVESVNMLMNYIGQETNIREKRSLLSSFFGLGELVASYIYTGVKSNERQKKIENFANTFKNHFSKTHDALEDLENFAIQQVTLNAELIFSLNKVGERIQDIQEDLRKFNETSQAVISHEMVIASVTSGYQDIISFVTSLMRALVDAHRGSPNPFLLSADSVYRVLKHFRLENRDEKLTYGESDVMSVYSLAKVRVAKHGRKIAIIHELNLPTSTTRGTLYRLQSFPIFLPDKEIFLRLKITKPYFALNKESEYMALSEEELNSCEKNNFITLCGNKYGIWKPSSVPSCEAAIYYKSKTDMQKLCDFEVLTSKTPMIQYLEGGEYHISHSEAWSIPITCTEENSRENHLLEPIDVNGFLSLSTRCRATVNSVTIENYLADKLDDFKITNNSVHMNYTDTEIIKHNEFESIINTSTVAPLINEEILENYRKTQKNKDTIAKIETFISRKYEETEADNAKFDDHEAEVEDAIEEWTMEHEEIDHSYAVNIYICASISCISLVLICIICYIMMKLNSAHNKTDLIENVEECHDKK